MKQQIIPAIIISVLFISCDTLRNTTVTVPAVGEIGVQRSSTTGKKDNNSGNTKNNNIIRTEEYMSSESALPSGNYYIINVKTGLAIQGSASSAANTPLASLQRGDALQVFKVQKTAKGYRVSMAGSTNLQFVCYCGGGYSSMMVFSESKEMTYKLIPAGSRSWYLSFLPQMGNYVVAQKGSSASYTGIGLGPQVKNEEAEWRFIPARDMTFED